MTAPESPARPALTDDPPGSASSGARTTRFGHRAHAPHRVRPSTYLSAHPRGRPNTWFRGPRAVRAVAAGLVLLTLMAYGNTLANGFVGDDRRIVTAAAGWRGLEDLAAILGGKAIAADSPVALISLSLDHAVAGLRPWFFHLTSLIYHLLTSFLVFLVISRLARSERLGAVAAVLFCVHPVQSGAASCVSGRPELLSAMFSLLALDAFLRRRSGGPWWTVLVATAAYALAVLAKSAALVLPAGFVLHDLIVECRQRPGRPRAGAVRWLAASLLSTLRSRGRLHLVFLGTAAALLSLGWLVHGSFPTGAPSHGEGMSSRVATELSALGRMVGLVLWPARLAPACTYTGVAGPEGAWHADTLGALLVLPALLFWALTRLRSHPEIAFGVLWFLLLLLASSPLVSPYAFRAEHDLYLPMVGVGLVLAMGFRALERNAGPTVAASALILVTAVLAGRTILRNREYRSATTYWSAAVRAAPDHPEAHLNLARTLAESGDLGGAIEAMKPVIAITSGDARAHLELGMLFARAARWKEAEGALLRAVKRDGALRSARLELARVLDRMDRPRDALAVLEQAASRWPDDMTILSSLAESLRANGRIDSAKEVLARLVAANPRDARPLHDLGRIAFEGADYEAARRWLMRARDLAPDRPTVPLLLGECLVRMGREQDAIDVYECYLKRWPKAANRYRIAGTLLRLRRRLADRAPVGIGGPEKDGPEGAKGPGERAEKD